MQTDCEGRDIDAAHLNGVSLDVATVAANLIPRMRSSIVRIGEVKEMMAGFHSCHHAVLMGFHVGIAIDMGFTRENLLMGIAERSLKDNPG